MSVKYVQLNGISLKRPGLCVKPGPVNLKKVVRPGCLRKTEYFNNDHNWMFSHLGVLDKLGQKQDDRNVYG